MGDVFTFIITNQLHFFLRWRLCGRNLGLENPSLTPKMLDISLRMPVEFAKNLGDGTFGGCRRNMLTGCGTYEQRLYVVMVFFSYAEAQCSHNCSI